MKKGIVLLLVSVAVLAGLGLALWLRLDFILNRRQLPVVWDAAGYHIQGREFNEAWKASNSEAFDLHFRKAYEMALPKCEVYPLFISGVYYFWGMDSGKVRVAQAALGVLCCLLLFLIARRVFHLGPALAALFGAAVYIPFILSEGRLLTETVAIFVLLLTTWLLIVSCRRGGWWWLILGGLATAVLMVTRTFFQYIFVVYVPLVFFALRREKVSLPGLKTIFYVLAIAAVIVPRWEWTSEVDPKGRRWLSGSWRNGLAIYTGIHPPNQGLQTDADPGGELMQEVRRDNPPGTDIEDIYFQSYFRTLVRAPGQAVPVLLAKGWLFWHRAYNDFLQSYLLSPPGIDVMNRVWLLGGVFGLGLALGRGGAGWIFLATALYIWALCFAADAESRYTLPAMPFMIAAACNLAWEFFSRLRASRRLRGAERNRLVAGLLVILAAALAVALARPGRLISLLGIHFSAAFDLWLGLTLLLVFSPLPLMLLLCRPLGRLRWWAAVAPSVLLAAVLLSAVSVHRQWHEWSLRLSRPGQTVSQRISLPGELERYRSAVLKLDLLSGPSRHFDLEVRLDGKPVRIFQRGLTPDPGSYITTRRAFPVYLKEQNRGFSQVRQWYSVPLDLEKLRGREEVTVELEFRPLMAGAEAYVEVYGDYLVAGEEAIFDGPTFSQSPQKLSLYRYLFFDDWRLWDDPQPLEAAAKPADGALGRYRILLNLSKMPERRGEFSVAVKSEEYLTTKTHLANYYNMQVWELNPWKKAGDLMLIEAAHAAPGREGGFYLVVYEDSDGDAKPDRLLAQSSWLEGKEAGEWSSWTVEIAAKNIFLGMTWPQGSPTLVYREGALWPDEMFPEEMYYRTGPNAPKANPVLTNLRVFFPPPENRLKAED